MREIFNFLNFGKKKNEIQKFFQNVKGTDYNKRREKNLCFYSSNLNIVPFIRWFKYKLAGYGIGEGEICIVTSSLQLKLWTIPLAVVQYWRHPTGASTGLVHSYQQINVGAFTKILGNKKQPQCAVFMCITFGIIWQQEVLFLAGQDIR